MIYYEAEKQFKNVESKPVVPEHLLNKGDFEQTYISAAKLDQTIADYRAEHKARNEE